MKTNDLVSFYVAFVEGSRGKKRPVLVRSVTETRVTGFKITTKYANKSAFIRRQYYQIQDWQVVGLRQPSWIDIGRLYSFPKHGLHFKEIGHLTPRDQIDLDRFNTRFKEAQEKRSNR